MGMGSVGGVALLVALAGGCTPGMHAGRPMHTGRVEAAPVSTRHETRTADLRIGVEVPRLVAGRLATMRVTVTEAASGQPLPGQTVTLSVGHADAGVVRATSSPGSEGPSMDLTLREVGPGTYEAVHTFPSPGDVVIAATVAGVGSTVVVAVSGAGRPPAGAGMARGWPIFGSGLMVAMMVLRLTVW